MSNPGEPVRATVLTRTEFAKCHGCGARFEATIYVFFGKPIFPQLFCAKCVAERERLKAEAEAEKKRRKAAADRQALQQSWQDLCPARFRDSERDRLPLKPVDALARVINWRPSEKGRGLGLIGSVQIGKKRLLFLLAKALHFLGIRIQQTSAIEFERLCVLQFDDDVGSTARGRLEQFRSVPVLLFFDLGFAKFSERMQIEFFGLVEHRAQQLLPTLWTSHLGAEELAAKFSDQERGRAAIGRLWQCSEVIRVGRKTFVSGSIRMPQERSA